MRGLVNLRLVALSNTILISDPAFCYSQRPFKDDCSNVWKPFICMLLCTAYRTECLTSQKEFSIGGTVTDLQRITAVISLSLFSLGLAPVQQFHIL